ncbi:hypothetical protein AB0N14_13785 [Streptomyces sp. NPDC051104]|uniref:hypothetical protein n=1 Tax=Streptomyces sp. NPDC051104 TaxID=3155044 RepID=UPI00342CA9EE
MSTSIQPIRLGHLWERPTRKPRHRAVDEVERLTRRLQWADSLIKTLHGQLADAEARHASEQKRLQAALRAWEARWANAHPVHVPAPRDLRPVDERPTVPTDVSQVRAIFPVVPIPERPRFQVTERPAQPDATNPAHIPAT